MSKGRLSISGLLALALGCSEPSPQTRTNASAATGAICVREADEWSDEVDRWRVGALTIGSQQYARPELLGLLEAHSRGDASITLAQELIAARLNETYGAVPGADAAAALPLADAWMTSNRDPDGRLPYGTKCEESDHEGEKKSKDGKKEKKSKDEDEDESEESSGIAAAACKAARELAHRIERFNEGKDGAHCEPVPPAPSVASLPEPNALDACCFDPTCDRAAFAASGGVCAGDPRIRGPLPASADFATTP